MSTATARGKASPVASPLEHWHPVARIEKLGEDPLAVCVHGRELVVFRTESGVPAVLDGICPHRRMHLAEGKVEGEKLICPYHGWSFTPDGAATCPGDQQVTTRAETFDVAEKYGLVWARAQGSNAVIPELDVEGLALAAALQMRFEAPLELVVDSFAEMEHSGLTHLFFGYDNEQMNQVEIKVELADSEVRIIASGPARKLPLGLSLFDPPREGDLFVDDAKFFFSPVGSVADNYWIAPSSGKRRKPEVRGAVFCTPVNAESTEIFALYFMKKPRPAFIFPIVKWFFKKVFVLELERDKKNVELLDREVALEGLTLNRFDRPLLEIRKRIDRLYRRSVLNVVKE